jgi:uncharacterized protein (TIGR02271 family)
MSITNMSDPNTITGAPVYGSDGEKLGKVHSIYYDNDTNKPEWAAVKSGLFGGHVSLVPLNQGSWDGGTLTVPFDKESLTNAPHHDPDREISRTDEEELYRHYGISTDRPGAPLAVGQQDPRAGDQRRDRAGETGIQGRDTSGPTTDEAMTRSEEQLHVGTETREAGRARLRKHIVTENVSTTVPVSHEEVTLEREPITEADRGAAMAGGELTEEEHEVTLHAERPVVEKEAVPVERVRLGTETVTEQHQVEETVRKERIEADGTEGVAVGHPRGGKHTARDDRR